mmetsp:Transcript_33636/g.64407  ORF Transcript_33636/g.64407 Transcript_33636/m.64407 type:complete len:211 (-) Transcript_33636:228-860(-)|eukprot:CAMPEP_0114253080 /NCGR_PEP_ID=MMETSP0058-20121206/16195_1 /TAXON_ID=36894 /ORGANISM="Pyramimonas parkeae, CCMP726" /LENGTH=210 /DNA_ID=CAMNT_0001367089 /DNA_START=174 /DNA_END=806 /DNA_ORIENTATION=-
MGPLGFLCGGGPAPIRDGKLGHITQSCIDAWKKHYGDHPATVCLKADPDPRKPLYYWQLYSLLGEQFATDLITNFYKRIFEDTDPEHKDFKEAFSFESLGYEFHVQDAADFWLDAMGAGPRYEGSIQMRTHGFHKIHRHVMTQKGAEIWMNHMRKAVEETDFGNDPRVKNTIFNFCFVMMEMYKNDFDFNTDEPVYGCPIGAMMRKTQLR